MKKEIRIEIGIFGGLFIGSLALWGLIDILIKLYHITHPIH